MVSVHCGSVSIVAWGSVPMTNGALGSVTVRTPACRGPIETPKEGRDQCETETLTHRRRLVRLIRVRIRGGATSVVSDTKQVRFGYKSCLNTCRSKITSTLMRRRNGVQHLRTRTRRSCREHASPAVRLPAGTQQGRRRKSYCT